MLFFFSTKHWLPLHTDLLGNMKMFRDLQDDDEPKIAARLKPIQALSILQVLVRHIEHASPFGLGV